MTFFHKIIDDFLPTEEFQKISKIYSTLQFKEIKSDLFSFTQSNELANDERFNFFIKRIEDVIFNQIINNDNNNNDTNNNDTNNNDTNNNDTNNGEYYFTFFASFYRKSDFLLCHDDMIDERVYAFTFYIQDFPTGNLILYEDDCKTVSKSIEIISNRIVIFEVGPNSFHEVDFCHSDGRKAISGWLNKKGKKNISKNFIRKQIMNKNLEIIDFGEEFNKTIQDSNFIMLDFDDSITDDVSTDDVSISGPFIDRRIYNINLKRLFAPHIENYEIIHSEGIIIKEGCYILCNDIINDFKDEDIIDVFIFKNKKEEVFEGIINYIDENQNTVFKLDSFNNKMIVGRRNKNSLCINRMEMKEEEVLIKHFIYIKKN